MIVSTWRGAPVDAQLIQYSNCLLFQEWVIHQSLRLDSFQLVITSASKTRCEGWLCPDISPVWCISAGDLAPKSVPIMSSMLARLMRYKINFSYSMQTCDIFHFLSFVQIFESGKKVSRLTLHSAAFHRDSYVQTGTLFSSDPSTPLTWVASIVLEKATCICSTVLSIHH
jgi:hypothetical protein